MELPEWFYNLQIDNLTIEGEMTDEQEDAIKEHFPNANVRNARKTNNVEKAPETKNVKKARKTKTAKAVKSGDKISGTVSDEVGPLMGATVCEINANGRIIESVVTDMNGAFSMKVKNPQNRLRFSYVGLNTVIMPIDKKEYKIKMEAEINQHRFKLEPREKQYRYIPVDNNI